MKVKLNITGRFYHSATDVPETLELQEHATLDDALAVLEGLLPDEASLPPTCLIAISGRHVGTVGAHHTEHLKDGDELVFVSPVAGG